MLVDRAVLREAAPRARPESEHRVCRGTGSARGVRCGVLEIAETCVFSIACKAEEEPVDGISFNTEWSSYKAG